MYFFTASFLNKTSLFVSVNSTNDYVATANNDGNIKIRSMSQFTHLIPNKSLEEEEEEKEKEKENLAKNPDGDDVDRTKEISSIIDLDKESVDNNSPSSSHIDKQKLTVPTRKTHKSPTIDQSKLELAQHPVNIIGVRSRSKITSLKYANLKSHSNLLAAVYKNGEVYMVSDPQNSAKCAVRQIFKHVNGLILDFSWSADDQLLAFSSMNDEVIIYDVIYSRIISVLHLHEIKGNGTTNISSSAAFGSNVPVKGISFDNTSGKYLLTLGDDKLVNILEYSLVPDDLEGRKFEYNITQRFSKLINSSKLNKATIRKVSWSKDDRTISVPNASKSKTSIISVLFNDTPNFGATWDKWHSFTGHGFKSTMTQFSPCTYRKEGSDPVFTYVLATASPDSSIAIWKTSEDRPLFMINEISPQPIQDICWSQNGRLLFLTTSSGHMILVVFDEGELGEVVPESECIKNDINSGASKAAPEILETFDKWMRKEKDTRPQLKLAPKLKTPKTIVKNEGKSKLQSAIPGGTASADATDTSVDNTEKDKPIDQTKNGKKRSHSAVLSENHKSGLNSNNSLKKPSGPTSDFVGPSTSVPKSLAHRISKGNQLDGAPRKKRELESVEFAGSVAINPQISFSNIRIAVPKVRAHINYSLLEDSSMCLEVTNGNGHESYPSRIALLKRFPSDSTKEVFVDFIPHRVHIITGSGTYWAISTTNGQIITYTNSGRRVLPTMILGSPLSFLEMKDQFLMAVTSVGEMYAWDLRRHKALFRPTSLYPLLQPIYRAGGPNDSLASGNQGSNNGSNGTGTGGAASGNTQGTTSIDKNGIVFVNGDLLTRSENLTMCSITSTGLPIVTLSNGNGYLYDSDMGTWSLVSDSWWAFGSQYWDSTQTLTSSTSSTTEDSSLLNYLEIHTNEEIVRRGKAKFFSKISKVMLMKEGFENLETVISLNHLENKINLYQFLNDFKNFKTYLIVYVKRLSELNLKDRLIEIFQELFIDMNGKICGVEKKHLLEELILSCSKQREVQRILVQYGESIGLLENNLL
ncbi:hypothetical protein FOA43_003046 [Brettanomyces nanus]|uniref:Protein HIR n=1 Tax=Eeniella nana TaxID=13502 RepID=A0A875RVN5_EENNA|nr:uncharacterized protein FOA43_003046 [Brettanomyces nanus]QPG75687.1 hypothetical protein FOA43_003046 [Brettanomyces nanus]